MKYCFLSPFLLVSAVTSCSEELNAWAKDPNVSKCREIRTAFIQSEVSLHDAAILKALIHKQQEKFQERERGRCSEVMRYCTIDIERTFDEQSEDPIAQLTINAVKEYERNSGWGWSLLYQWNTNPDSTRSLWCVAQVNPDELEVALAKKEEV